MDNVKIVNPGQTANIGSPEGLTQVQHKGDHVEIVDHHGPHGSDHAHTVTTVRGDGSIGSESG